MRKWCAIVDGMPDIVGPATRLALISRGGTFAILVGPGSLFVDTLGHCPRCDVSGRLRVYVREGDVYHHDCDLHIGGLAINGAAPSWHFWSRAKGPQRHGTT
jgi:hypothetical protein